MFLQGFPSDKCYNTSGRGSIPLEAGIDDLAKRLMGFAKVGSKAKGMVSQSERTFLNQPWVYGYSSVMKSCGAEYGYLGSLKVATAGVRRIRCAGLEDLYQYVSSTKPARIPISLQDCSDVLCNADESVVQ